ncbi:MAG: hypothetical protein K6U89_19760, partial [Chloroflexi bacterium]|nr:hypothetical protein [Chloroflexota bacterium]
MRAIEGELVEEFPEWPQWKQRARRWGMIAVALSLGGIALIEVLEWWARHEELQRQRERARVIQLISPMDEVREEVIEFVWRPSPIADRYVVEVSDVGYQLIWRSPPVKTVELRLPDARVASHHAYFQLIGGRLAAFDLGSRSGLRWEDGRPLRSGWRDPGRVGQVGPFLVRRLLDPGEVPAPADADIPPHNLRWTGGGPNVVLIFPDQLPGPIRWKMTRVVTLVGRAPGCRVRLPDESVAWYHAALVRTPAGVWLVDLLGHDRPAAPAATPRHTLLPDHAQVTVGRFRIIVRYEHAASPATPAAALSTVADHSAEVPATPLPPRPPEPPVELPLEPELISALEAVRNDAAATPALMRLVEQFGQMQHQMLEQFYQSTLALVSHLDEHYRDQLRQLHAELDGLRSLSRELAELGSQLGPPTAPPPSPSGPSLPPPQPSPPPAAINGRPPWPPPT